MNAVPKNQQTDTDTPLYFATNSNATETAKILLDSGANTSDKAFYESAISAKQKQLQPLSKLLFERANDQALLTTVLKSVDGGINSCLYHI